MKLLVNDYVLCKNRICFSFYNATYAVLDGADVGYIENILEKDLYSIRADSGRVFYAYEDQIVRIKDMSELEKMIYEVGEYAPKIDSNR